MRKFLNTAWTVLTVIAVAVFFTAWLNVIPTLWQKGIMDTPLLWGLTVRHVITFLGLLSIAILCHHFIAKHTKTVCLAALLPVLVWVLHWLFYFNGPSDLAKQYPIFGVLLVWTGALLIEAVALEFKNHTFGMKDVLEDFLFSLSLSLLFYGIITVLGFNPFEANTLGMAPVLALVKLWLAKTYHTPKA